MSSLRPATILHTSDVHLDRDDGGRHQQAFAAAIDLAIELDVDAVFIMGDLFDHARVHDEILTWTADQLDRLERPVVLLVGNHDALHDRSVHHRFEAGSRCKDVLFLDEPDGSVAEVTGTDIVVWGRAMIEHEPAYRPLAGSVPRRDDAWNIVAAHGLIMEDESDSYRSSPMYPSELDGLDCDYVALGHIHQHLVVRTSPLTCYPGATAYSLNGKAGCVIVEFVPGEGAALRWVPLLSD